MTKVEFLNELRNKLEDLPIDEIENRISFYSEMIDDMVDEGKTESDAIDEIGSTDDIIKDIVKDIPLTKLVKQKVKPNRKLSGLEITLLILGFPLWFPLLLTFLVLCLVFYILVWVFVIVAYSVELSFVAGGIGSLIAFFGYLINGSFHLMSLGAAISLLGLSVLMFFVCKEATKMTLKFSNKILIKIKESFIKKGERS